MIVHSFLYVYQRIKFWDYVKLHSYRKHDQSRGICPDHLLDLTPAESWNALKAEEGLGSCLRNTLTGSVWWPGHSQCSVLLQFCCYIYPLKFPWYIYIYIWYPHDCWCLSCFRIKTPFFTHPVQNFIITHHLTGRIPPIPPVFFREIGYLKIQ